MRKIILPFLICLFQLSFCQKYDYHWILGEQGAPNLTGNMDIIFTDSSADTIRNRRGVEMDNSQTTVSDSDGNLIFFTNGARIYNRNDSIMQNGDSLNYGPAWDQYFYGIAYNTLEEIVGIPTNLTSKWNLLH